MSKILLAEDDTDMRRFLVKALQNAGFDVTSYDNGLSAYHRLREEPFELLLTDIVMPEMDGIELARRAAELDPDIKIMFITGFAAVGIDPAHFNLQAGLRSTLAIAMVSAVMSAIIGVAEYLKQSPLPKEM